MKTKIGILDDYPRAKLAHAPTPIDAMPNLSAHFGGGTLFVKRDDCSGLGMGGNKARQLEFYLGQAVKQQADTILITGAVQSNYVRTAAAAARKMGMDIHIQLEERVANPPALYRHSGNVLLNRIYGATLYSYPDGEDEAGADRQLEIIAGTLRDQGKSPYVIHLSAGHPPLGALGYVDGAREIVSQMDQASLQFDEIVVATGSGATHAGLLFGLRAMGCNIPVIGACVRRTKELQTPRIIERCTEIADLLKIDNPVDPSDVTITDDALAPGYGKLNDSAVEAITLSAHKEGIILDPVYTAKSMAGFIVRARCSKPDQNLLFIHTGGQPAIFGYESDLEPFISDNIPV